MTRKTSIETFRAIESEGLLSKRRFEVYEVIYRNGGPMTYSEVIKEFRKRKDFATSSTYQARLSELRDLGVIYEVKEDICPITGRIVIFWDITGNLPRSNKLSSTQAEQKQNPIKLLEEISDSVSQAFLGPELAKKIDLCLIQNRKK